MPAAVTTFTAIAPAAHIARSAASLLELKAKYVKDSGVGNAPPPSMGGGRYAIEKAIGQGGMALVYQALDATTGRRVALKQLRADGDDAATAQRSREQFQREFHTLVQLAHPRIVAAIDYGLEGNAPYYTMELLDGGDLRDRSPMPWRQACAVARDLCSALSLVHSRRMVYRDLSPRNVRCTSDGTAKLIDFGAMAPMGSGHVVVCTPAVAAPELVYRQVVDGRADLYALGATLYCTLLGYMPYAARNFQQLAELWQRTPARPSAQVPEIPPALDALVMELLQLDPQLRPSSAAEVSQRLCAIAGLDADEQLTFSQAYLTTPNLVGRERELGHVHGVLKRLQRGGSGGALLLRGAAGVGRSRLLDGCVLAAKLAGVSVAHVTAASAPSGRYGVARAIASHLLEILPDETASAAAQDRDVLCALLPALRERVQPPPVEPSSVELEQRATPALRAFVRALTRQRPLVLALDDVERFDAESRSLVALLAHDAGSQPLVVIATSASEPDAAGDALRMLAAVCRPLNLRALDAAQTQALLASMFGDVPNLSRLVRRLDELAAGNPRDLLHLCQHLLDRGVVRYRANAWELPDRLDVADLPATMAQAFADTVHALDDDARALARAFAQCPDEHFSFDECAALCLDPDRVRVFRALDQLLRTAIVLARGSDYALAAKVWVGALTSTGDDPELQVRLAQVFARRGDGLRAARHLFRVGRDQAGLNLLVAYAEESRRLTITSSEAYVNMLLNVPQDWMEIYERGLSLCEQLGRPERDTYLIEIRLSSVLGQHNVASNGHQARLSQRLAYHAGLDLYAALDPALPAAERLQRALAGASQRHLARPEAERVLDPRSAIGGLARTLIVAVGSFARTLDVAEWRQLPSLAPFCALSPSVAVVDRLVRGFDARISGRFERAFEIYEDTLALIEQTGGGGLDKPFVETLVVALPASMGAIEAVLGLPSAEQRAERVAGDSLFHGSALAIRLLAALWHGDAAGADLLARQLELWRLEQSRQQASDVQTVLWTLPAHAASDDLTRTRQDLEAIERTAARIRSWQPLASWARGEYERIRGDLPAALTALDLALAELPPGQHQVWPMAAAARLRVLCEQERYAEARSDGERDLALCSEHGLGFVANYVRMQLAFACAGLGDADAAWAHARAAIDSFEQLGARGLNLGLAYECGARVAAALDDADAHAHYAELCKGCFLAHLNPALAAKYQRVLQSFRRTGPRSEPGALRFDDGGLMRTQLETMLQSCSGRQERLERSLELLVSATGARSAVLYALDQMEEPCARSGEDPLPSDVAQLASRHLEYALGAGAEQATVDAQEPGSNSEMWTSSIGHCYRPILLSHQARGGFVISGLVVLRCEQPLLSSEVGRTATQISRIAVDHGDLHARLVG